MGESEGSGRMLALGTLRALCMGLVLTVAFFILGWMYMEQDKVQMCTQFKATETAAASSMSKPIQVIVKAPENNSTTKPPWDYNWDRQAWKNPDDAKGVGVRTLILVRHGEYDFGSGKLTEKGRQQANLTGMRLKALNMPYLSITHSTMIRAVETAELIHAHLKDLPIEADEMLIEGGPEPPQPTITYWGLPERTYFVDGPRMESAFRKYVHRADITQKTQSHQILVAHGNIFRFFALRALQFPKNAWMRVFIAHASITVLHINPDGTVNMNKFGDAGHFPPNMVTY